MKRINRQKEAIAEIGSYLSNELFKSEGLDILSNNWSLSEDVKRFLGEEGRVEIDSSFSTGNLSFIENDLLDEIEKLDILLSELFSNVTKIHPTVTIKNNKLIMDSPVNYGNNGEIVLYETRKTFNKTLKYYLSIFFTKQGLDYDIELLEKIEKRRTYIEQALSRSVDKEGKLIISGLPEDILTASISGYGWGSCYTPGHDHEITPYGYLMGGKVMIAYFSSTGSGKLKYNFGDVDKKVWRQWVFINDNGDIVLPSEQYPATSEETSNKLIEVFKDIIGSGATLQRINTYTSGSLYYDDLEYAISNEVLDDSTISTKYLKCLVTGKDLNDYSDYTQSLVDLEHFGYIECDYCGDFHPPRVMEKAVNKKREEYYVCSDCIDEYVYSEVEGAYILRELSEDYILRDADYIRTAFPLTVNSMDNMTLVECDYLSVTVQDYSEDKNELYLELIYNTYGIETQIQAVEKV